MARIIDSFVQEPRNLIGGDPGASNDDVGPGLGGTVPMGTVANLHAGPIKRDRAVRDVINQLPGENDMPHQLVDLTADKVQDPSACSSCFSRRGSWVTW